MRCASCGFENAEGLKFCNECGTSLKQRCAQCGFENAPQAKFCGECGTTLRAAETSPPAKRRKRKGSPSTRQARRSATSPTAVKSRPAAPEAERRQLTVMFCDLVGSTILSTQLDPEELREVVQAYQETCTAVIQRYEGYIAQHLGDGLLVYFGYPIAHEDEPQRAVRTSLEIIEALHQLNPRLPRPLQVRIGIHTGLVVVGEIGSGAKREVLALGETPNLAARLQGLAEPNTVVISEATYHLVQGLFTCQALASQAVKGFATPLTVYRVLRASETQSRFEVAVTAGLTSLVGREHEIGLLRERWAKAKAGEGQVVLLSGEPGIGKSRLAQEIKEQVTKEDATRIEFRCSPYFQNSALYPILNHLQRLLQFARDDTPATKLGKLQHTLNHYRFPQADTVPLLAALLSLPPSEGCPPLSLSPQKQKQKTHEALVAWIMEEAERQVVYCTWEDLHWADPTTLEILQLYLEQIPAARMLAVLTFRPEFQPPWSNRSYLSQLTLSRLEHPQVKAMIENVTGGKALPSEIVQQIVAKTDGVPLFVEELTKTVVESGLDGGTTSASPLPLLAIPTTLHDTLMARLDRLSTTRQLAQLGATIGREFSYDLLHAVSPVNETLLQQGLRQLVEAELLYQRGVPPHATYLFKHALIQDTAYQSLLKSTRQQYHQQIAQVLEERFPETKETQPEIVAYHYTEAGLIPLAVPYWQRAGQRAVQRSANVEAISHLTKGLEVLKTLPDTPERTQQELMLQTTLGTPLMITKGYAAAEAERAYARARELCRQMGETPQLFLVLLGLWAFYFLRGMLHTARELAEQLLRLAQSAEDPELFVWAHHVLGATLFHLGELVSARAHLEQSIALYDPQKHRPDRSEVFRQQDPGVTCRCYVVPVLWSLGCPDQALERSHEALSLAQELSHPFSLAWALHMAGRIHKYRQERQVAQEQAEATIALSTEQGFAQWVAYGTVVRGWALAEQGQWEEGIVQMRQGLAAWRATGAELAVPEILTTLAEAYGKAAQTEEGLTVVAEALALVDKNKEHCSEAELYRLKGELTLQQERQRAPGNEQQATVANARCLMPDANGEAEACFLKAINIAQKQQAKSWELRAATSQARLWQQQGKRDDARQMLAEVYNWFTEGLDTKDLQEAKALLEELS